MEKYAWKAKVVDGQIHEYERRHREIWPELKEVLKEAGIRNYTIWTDGINLFGYYECDSVKFASDVQNKSEVVKKWDEYMKDVLIMEKDPVTGAQPLMRNVFSFE